MNPIGIILHIGDVIRTVKDLETAIKDLVHGNPSKEDAKRVIQDIIELFEDGLIPLPKGLDAVGVKKALEELAGIV